MSKLDEYALFNEKKKELFTSCTRAAGPWKLLPTNKGGIILTLNNQDVKSDVSIKELKELRDVIGCFLDEVVK